jgi:hypothetical protein
LSGAPSREAQSSECDVGQSGVHVGPPGDTPEGRRFNGQRSLAGVAELAPGVDQRNGHQDGDAALQETGPSFSRAIRAKEARPLRATVWHPEAICYASHGVR